MRITYLESGFAVFSEYVWIRHDEEKFSALGKILTLTINNQDAGSAAAAQVAAERNNSERIDQ